MVGDRSHRVGAYACPGNIWAIDLSPPTSRPTWTVCTTTSETAFLPTKSPWTKLRDEMPSRYLGDARVKNALIADGCVIEGTVENSVLFRGVHVKPGAVVKTASSCRTR